MPILSYSSEIWISDIKINLLDNNYQSEKSIYILGVNRKRSTFCKCDLGRFPILIVILKHVFVLLLLIYCLMYFPLFVGALCLSLFGIHYFMSLEEEEGAGCFAFKVLQMYCSCKCSVALPRGAVGWSAVGNCGIS